MKIEDIEKANELLAELNDLTTYLGYAHLHVEIKVGSYGRSIEDKIKELHEKTTQKLNEITIRRIEKIKEMISVL